MTVREKAYGAIAVSFMFVLFFASAMNRGLNVDEHQFVPTWRLSTPRFSASATIFYLPRASAPSFVLGLVYYWYLPQLGDTSLCYRTGTVFSSPSA